jgi:hypothetical protein
MDPLDFYPFTDTALSPEIRHRLEGEARMIEHLVSALKLAGWHPTGVDDGGDEPVSCGSPREILEAVFAVEEATLFVERVTPEGKHQRGAVQFILGNAPEEVAADWSGNLSDVLDEAVMTPPPPAGRPPRGIGR